jgi:hypothetical protein
MFNMRKNLSALIVCTAVAAMPGLVYAKGCVKGAAVGAVAGHVAGHHAVAGAAVGCLVGHHHAKVKEREAREQAAATQQNTNAPPNR